MLDLDSMKVQYHIYLFVCRWHLRQPSGLLDVMGLEFTDSTLPSHVQAIFAIFYDGRGGGVRLYERYAIALWKPRPVSTSQLLKKMVTLVSRLRSTLQYAERRIPRLEGWRYLDGISWRSRRDDTCLDSPWVVPMARPGQVMFLVVCSLEVSEI